MSKNFKMPPNTVTILGIKINSSSTSSLLKEIVGFASVQGQPKIIFTPNPEFLVAAHDDPEFKKILNEADINLPDGIGLVWAGRILGQRIKERVSGADVVERLLEEGNKKKWEVGSGKLDEEVGGGKWAIGIAGARKGVLTESDELVERLKGRYPNLGFANLDNPKFSIFNFQFSIVLACHGMGEQEKWIMENKDKISSSIFMGVGGSLDFLTGFSKRAPTWIRTFGFEWLWRGLQKPGHWKRIWRATIVFGWLVIKESFTRSLSR